MGVLTTVVGAVGTVWNAAKNLISRIKDSKSTKLVTDTGQSAAPTGAVTKSGSATVAVSNAQNWIKTNWLYLLLGGVVIFVIWKFILKGGRTRRRGNSSSLAKARAAKARKARGRRK